MIPKVGDVVDINPLFKKAWNTSRNTDAYFGDEGDGHIHITNILNIGKGFDVHISTGGGYRVDDSGFAYEFPNLDMYGYVPGTPLFLLVGPKFCMCEVPDIVEGEILGEIIRECRKCKKLLQEG